MRLPRPARPGFFATCCLLCLILSAATAGIGPLTSWGPVLVQQRKLFLTTEEALRQGRIADYRRLKTGLRGYPLLAYLDYAELQANPNRLEAERVRQFLNDYADSAMGERLLGEWLALLANQERWAEFAEFYTPAKSTERRCQYLHALIATGRQAQAFPQVGPMWQVGRSQPHACDPVFDAWIQAGQVTPEQAWARIILSIDNGENSLAQQLTRYLPPEDGPWVERWIRVRATPERILDGTEFATAHPRRGELLLYGLQRLARFKPTQVQDAWIQLRRRYTFTPAQTTAAEAAVTDAWRRTVDPVRLERIGEEPEGDVTQFLTKRILLALKDTDWRRILILIDALPPQDQDSEQWRYWKGRALQQLGREAEARTLLRQVAQDRTYYAFLAADRIGQPYNLTHQPVRVTAARLAWVENHGAALRAQELRILGRAVDARREWAWLTRDMDNESLQAAARVAANWGWPDQAIFTLARSGCWDDLELRFPVLHRQLVEKNAARNGVQTPWVFAVMRQESAFAPDAQSQVGARGLMQLMPATASVVAKRLGQPLVDNTELFRPETNIPLGTAYLSEVYKRLGRHPVLATAAYNAGPGRVNQWLPPRTQDADIWVETIPFKETRTYVQRVMAYAVIYEKRLGLKSSSIAERMRPIIGTSEHVAADTPAAPISRG